MVTSPLFLAALFIDVCGLALLQVAVNPYLGALGRPERAAFRLNLAGGFNSVAGTIAPRLGAAFIFISVGANSAELARSVRGPYFVLAVVALALASMTALMSLPDLLTERVQSSQITRSAWSFRRLGFWGTWGLYLCSCRSCNRQPAHQLSELALHGRDEPSRGCTLRVVLLGRGNGGAICWILHPAARETGDRAGSRRGSGGGLHLSATFGHGPVALWALVSCGLFNSVMWPCILPMSIEGLGMVTSHGSGILVSMVVGGAIIPEVQAWLADHFGYQPSFLVILACHAYILFFALNGHRGDALVKPVIEPAVVL